VTNWYNIKFSRKIAQLVFPMFRGCRAQKLISEFTYNDVTGTADANIFSMFRFELPQCCGSGSTIPDSDSTFLVVSGSGPKTSIKRLSEVVDTRG
jgi:hypothetical protein